MNSKRLKNFKHKQYKRGVITRSVYKHSCKSLSKIIKTSKKNYYNDKFNEALGNIKKIWKIIDRTVNPSHKAKGHIDLCNNNETVDKMTFLIILIIYFPILAVG